MQALGQFGLQAIRDSLQTRSKASSDKLCILTHCNTGSLATAEYGTALGIIRAAAADGSLAHAYCTETRPYNQGTLHCIFADSPLSACTGGVRVRGATTFKAMQCCACHGRAAFTGILMVSFM